MSAPKIGFIQQSKTFHSHLTLPQHLCEEIMVSTLDDDGEVDGLEVMFEWDKGESMPVLRVHQYALGDIASMPTLFNKLSCINLDEPISPGAFVEILIGLDFVNLTKTETPIATKE